MPIHFLLSPRPKLGTTPLTLRLACLLLLIVTGCDNHLRSGDKPPDFTTYGTLPGLAKSPDSMLQDELARLQAESATPAQLQAANPQIPDEENVAAGLREWLTPEKVMRATNDVSDIYPREQFLWPASKLERARDLLKYHRATIDKLQTIVDRPQFALQIEFANGLLADVHVVDTATLAHLWLALDAAVSLADDDLARAEKNVARMLRLDHALAHESHLVPRLQAAALRLEALRVTEALIQHPSATPELAGRLRDLLAAQLAAWPDDAKAWNGDRAIGLHTYEMIRHGYILSVLSDDELASLRKQEGVSATAKAIQKHIDADERYYLTTLRETIAACEQPYFARRDLLAKIEQYLKESELSPEFPLVAGKILLTGLPAGHRRQAADRAAVAGWHLLLCAATGQPLAEPPINPLTGKAYQLQTESQRVLLFNAWPEDANSKLIVPRFDQ